MKYLGNAFSLGMLDIPEGAEAGLVVQSISLDAAREWLAVAVWESCVGHADTAGLLASMLGVEVEMRRVSLSLRLGDEILVAQYGGPRLPEGATSLPNGAKIRWLLVTV